MPPIVSGRGGQAVCACLTAPGPEASYCVGFSEDSRHFIQGVRHGRVQWGFSGKHSGDLTDVTVEDLGWLWPYLRQITPEEMRAGLAASGATPRQAACWTAALEERIRQIQAVTQSLRAAAAPAR